MSRAITVEDLKHAPENAYLFCPECFAQFSATPGDYFMKSKDKPFTHCRRNMQLVTIRTVVEDVKLPRRARAKAEAT
jgi:hypothetical protein